MSGITSGAFCEPLHSKARARDAGSLRNVSLTKINHPTGFISFKEMDQSLGSFNHIPYLPHQQEKNQLQAP